MAETEIEYGVNTVNHNGVKENPFDSNFDSEEEAVEAGLQLLREDPSENEVVIFQMEFSGDTIVSDVTLRTLTRADLGPGKVLVYFRAEPNVEYGECPDWVCWDAGASSGAVQLLKDMGRYGRPEQLSMSGMPLSWPDAASWGLADTEGMLQVLDGTGFLLSDYAGQYASPLCPIDVLLAAMEDLPPGQDVVLIEKQLDDSLVDQVELADNWKRVTFGCA